MSIDYEDYDFVDDDGVSYNVSPDVPPFVYIMSCFFMALVCVFGVVSNASIFVLFINSPLVSFFNVFSHFLVILIILGDFNQF